MRLQPTQVEYQAKDDKGNAFEVIAHMTPDNEWTASVTLRTAENAQSPESAVRALRMVGEAFLRALEEMGS
jgi:hypothetical protein